jgi:acetyl-CoA carboxylase biotin carboxyl carrier protein
MELTHKEVKNIIEIIDSAEHLDEIELVFSGFRLHVRRGAASDGGARAFSSAPPTLQPAPRPAALAAPAAAQPAPRAAQSSTTEVELAPGEVAIRAPMLGTFYRAASPGEKPFVEVGQQVKAEDNVCVIEVMKLFNTIQAGVDGTVVKIAVENASLVEYNQIMIVIAPTKQG